mmetsp:Transcript_42311/g.64894  ORF Transcript_42311/g.64894 Transcript_42311/m.64894 type:complete len:206 (-) Transcript_42311:19-636(-)
MNIVSLAYMVGIGLEQASCTLVGQQIGKGDVSMARKMYSTFKVNTAIILVVTSSMVFLFKEQLMRAFTSKESVVEVALGVIWLISINTFPDSYKGMLKGIIKALGIQHKCIIVNLTGHWFINLTLQWYFAIHLDLRILGLWMAKQFLELYIMTAYIILINVQDWDRISKESHERQTAEKEKMLAVKEGKGDFTRVENDEAPNLVV